MSSILNRLQRTLKGRKESYDEPAQQTSMATALETSTSLLDRLKAGENNDAKLEDLKGATEVDTPYGKCFQFVTKIPLGSCHGKIALEQAYSAEYSLLESLVGDQRLGAFNIESALFLDIEATGLDHGAGTFAFMIGLGYKELDHFIIKQLFLPEMHEEMPMLHVLKEHLDRFEFLISFNGKSYDLTVLQSRMILQRLYTPDECNLKLQPHLDLLHLARNMYRNCFSDTRLPTLERSVLDFHRQDDVPSALVPTMWYQYLRTKNAEPIRLVAEHNLYDILSMVVLAGTLAENSHLREILDCEPSQIALNLGRVWLRRKAVQKAVKALEAVDEMTLCAEETDLKYSSLNKAYGRLRSYELKGQALKQWCSASPTTPDAWIARAIFQERHEKNLSAALTSAQRAQTLMPSDENARRIERLNRRIKKSK